MGPMREIPATAVAIKVTNVSNPRYMIIYNEEDSTERLNEIGYRLRNQMKKRWKRKTSAPEPRIGDVVIMHNRVEPEIELPAWWVRGILGCMNEKTLEYNVLLVDHGYVVKAYREDFTVIPKTLIPNEYLTITVGLYNLLPTTCKSEISTVNMEITRQWSNKAIEITRSCISASSKIYFDYLAMDNKGEKYGEMYLILNNEIMSLSEILVANGCAIYMSKDLLSLIEGRNRDETKTINSVDDGIIVGLETFSLNPPRTHRLSVKNGLSEKESKAMRHVSTKIGQNQLIRYIGEDCQQILVHSAMYCDPLACVEDARFTPKIHAVLRKMDIIALRRIHSYMWPAINKGVNVLAIGPPRCGKTIGYVLPVVSCIASSKMVPKGNSPAILILCSSTSDVLNVRTLCGTLLEAYKDIRCVAGWNGRPTRSLTADIYNGCQILIATPAFLTRFINQSEGHKKLINFGNLTHLVIDGIDIILNKYYEPLMQLLAKHHIINKKKRTNVDEQPMQIIAVARHWSSHMAEFAKKWMTDLYVCIGSYMEAAVYGGIKPELVYYTTDNKIRKTIESLKNHGFKPKTMIICANGKEACELNEEFSKSQRTLLAHEDMIFSEINAIRECWRADVEGLYPVLICTDEVLVQLNITDVNWLIHYSITTPSKTQFYFRFSTIMDNLKKGKGNCTVTIVFDETNDVQLYGVVSIAERCGRKLAPSFMDKVMRVVNGLDTQKKMYPICDNVKAFGRCPKENACPYRHCVLADVDTPITSIKVGDRVRFNVTYVHNATHFTARVIEYTSSDGNVTRYSAEEYMKISSDIQTYYADKSKRRCHWNVKLGDICAVEESLDNFQRVKVLHIVEKNSKEVPIAVELKCIDTGAILPKIRVTRLLQIPEDLANRSIHILEVFLAGLVPYDDEYEWNYRAVDDAFSWFPNKMNQYSFVLGKVCLHLADTLWVDPLEIRTSIIGHPDLISNSLKRHMLRLKHGTLNKEHLPRLCELCRISQVRDAEGKLINSTPIYANENENDSISS